MTSLSQDGNIKILINKVRSSYRRHFKALQCENEALNTLLIRVLAEIYQSDPNNNSLEVRKKQRLSCSNSSFSSNNSEGNLNGGWGWGGDKRFRGAGLKAIQTYYYQT